jgi:hypothetical protein
MKYTRDTRIVQNFITWKGPEEVADFAAIVKQDCLNGRVPNNCKAVTACVLTVQMLQEDGVLISDCEVSGYAYCSGKDRFVALEGNLLALERAAFHYSIQFELPVPAEIQERISDWTEKVKQLKAKEYAKASSV